MAVLVQVQPLDFGPKHKITEVDPITIKLIAGLLRNLK